MDGLEWEAIGDVGAALDEYDRSVEERDSFLVYPLFPGYDPIRNEPRFRRGLERLGLDWAIGAGAESLPKRG